MSTRDDNLELVKRLHAGDRRMRDLVVEHAAPNIEWWAAGPRAVLPWAGTVRTPEGVRAWFETLSNAVEYDSFEPRQFIADGDDVVMIVSASAKARNTGKAIQSEIVRVFTIHDGAIVRVRNYYDTAAYVAALST